MYEESNSKIITIDGVDYVELNSKTITIDLSDHEYSDLCEFAEGQNTTINCLLEQFIADLTCSARSGDSIERFLVAQWFYHSFL